MNKEEVLLYLRNLPLGEFQNLLEDTRYCIKWSFRNEDDDETTLEKNDEDGWNNYISRGSLVGAFENSPIYFYKTQRGFRINGVPSNEIDILNIVKICEQKALELGWIIPWYMEPEGDY